MKKGIRKFFWMLSLSVLIAGCIYGKNVEAADKSITLDSEQKWSGEGYTLKADCNDEKNEAMIHIISWNESAESVNLIIPDIVTYNEKNYTVTGFGGFLNSSSYAAYAMNSEMFSKLSSIYFPKTLREVTGNLYPWQYEKMLGTTEMVKESLGIDTFTGFSGFSIPDTVARLSNIPEFISKHYEDGAFYAGKTLVRVDPDYKGDFTVKDGTICILASAFEGCNQIDKVTLPDTIEFIGVAAFANSSLTEINLPTGLMDAKNQGTPAIPSWCFMNCSNLRKVDIQCDSLKDISIGGFVNCSALEAFDFKKVQSVGAIAFANALKGSEDIEVNLSKVNLTGPLVFANSGIKSLITGANSCTQPETFRNCTNLSSVTWHNDLTSVYAWNFYGCTSLKDDILADADCKVTSLGFKSFAKTGMTEVTIAASNMEGAVFAENPQLETVNWKSTITSGNPLFAILNDCTPSGAAPYMTSALYNVDKTPADGKPEKRPDGVYIKNLNIDVTTSPFISGNQYFWIFLQQPYLENVNFISAVERIPSNAFLFCPSLKQVSFKHPESLKEIGSYAFAQDIALREFPFDQLKKLDNIGDYAFLLTQYMGGTCTNRSNRPADAWDNIGLKTIDLSETSVKSIGNGAFINQVNATTLHLPETFDGNLLSWQFLFLHNLEEVIVDGELKNDDYALIFKFYNDFRDGRGCNSSIKKIVLNNVNSLSYGSFGNFVALEEVVLNGNLDTIPENCFSYCENLRSVSLPEKVKTIKSNAFQYCSSLGEVEFPYVETLEAGAFRNADGLLKISLPKVTSIGDSAFLHSGLKTAAVQSGVNYGKYVFANCENLKEVKVEEGVTEIGDFMFANAPALVNVKLAESVKTIGWGAFKNSFDKNVETSMVLPGSVELMKDDAFALSGLKNLVIQGSPVINTVEEMAEGEYRDPNCEDLLPIPESISVFGDSSTVDAYRESFAPNIVVEKTFKIAKIEISGKPDGVTLNSEDTVLPASVLSGLEVLVDGEAMKADEVMTDLDTSDVSLGERTVKILNPMFSYSDEKGWEKADLSFKLVVKGNITQLVLKEKSFNYTGSAIKPQIEVKYGTKVLQNDKDYSVSYSNNIEAGTATVTVIGKGNYTGTLSDTFTITRPEPEPVPEPEPAPTPDPDKNTEQQITSVSADKMNASLYAAAKGSTLVVKWGKLAKVSGYDIFVQTGNRAYSSKPDKSVKATAKLSVTVRKAAGRKLDPKKDYKIRVKAYVVSGSRKKYVAKSYELYVPGSKSGKTFEKKVTVSKTNVTIKKGKTTTIKAKVQKSNAKKALLKKAKLRYWSMNKKVAVVSKSGRITAKGKGSTVIYVMAQNGMKAKVKVRVK